MRRPSFHTIQADLDFPNLALRAERFSTWVLRVWMAYWKAAKPMSGNPIRKMASSSQRRDFGVLMMIVRKSL